MSIDLKTTARYLPDGTFIGYTVEDLPYRCGVCTVEISPEQAKLYQDCYECCGKYPGWDEKGWHDNNIKRINSYYGTSYNVTLPSAPLMIQIQCTVAPEVTYDIPLADATIEAYKSILSKIGSHPIAVTAMSAPTVAVCSHCYGGETYVGRGCECGCHK